MRAMGIQIESCGPFIFGYGYYSLILFDRSIIFVLIVSMGVMNFITLP
jgi:hypothetical protein